jgi:cbb3-type cytochrome oxidase subunit 1
MGTDQGALTMPKLSVWFVRASLLYMGIGFLFGAQILHHKGIPIYGWTWRLLNPHIEIMIFGWTMQFIMGIAFWILPRFSGKERYGKEALGWWSFALLNIGISLTALSLWENALLPALIGRLLTAGALLLFTILMFPRVKPLGGYTQTELSIRRES